MYFQDQLYEERLNTKAITEENIHFKEGLVEKMKKQIEGGDQENVADKLDGLR